VPVARAPRWAVPLLFCLLLAGFAAGIWGSYRAAFPAPGLYRVTGVFETRAGERLIIVRHDAVAGLMDEMSSMVFTVASGDLLDRARLERGDRIRLTVKQAGAELVAVDIQKIP
jgi:Cu/Ag efflux protein CusF